MDFIQIKNIHYLTEGFANPKNSPLKKLQKLNI